MNLHVELAYSDNINLFLKDYQVFFNRIASNNSQALPNMGHDAPAGLMYIAQKNLRWQQGQGHIAFLYDSDQIVGVSCVEHSTLHVELGSGGNRCWLLKEYRLNHIVSKYLLSSNLNWCEQNGKKGMLLSFNNYNKWIYDSIAKISSGQGRPLGRVWSNWWNNCLVFPRMIRLFNTLQWAVIKPVTNNDNGDLNKIILEVDSKYGIVQHHGIVETEKLGQSELAFKDYGKR